MTALAWTANAVLIVGVWLLGRKRRVAFLLTAAGEALWVVVSVSRGYLDMIAICVIFLALAIRNYWLWTEDERGRNVATGDSGQDAGQGSRSEVGD